MQFLDFDEELNEVAQTLDDAVAHLYPHPQSSSATTGPHSGPLPHLLYNSESKPDSDNEMNPDLP